MSDGSNLDIVSEMRDRIAKLEASQAELHTKVDNAVKAGTIDPNLAKHAAHVLNKHFYHDQPDAVN